MFVTNHVQTSSTSCQQTTCVFLSSLSSSYEINTFWMMTHALYLLFFSVCNWGDEKTCVSEHVWMHTHTWSLTLAYNTRQPLVNLAFSLITGDGWLVDGEMDGPWKREWASKHAGKDGKSERERDWERNRESDLQTRMIKWKDGNIGWSKDESRVSLSLSVLWCRSVCCRQIHFQHDVTSCLALFQSPLPRFHSIMHHTHI